MKSLLAIILCFAGLKSFAQTNDVVVEEKASNWIKITAPVPSRTTTTVKKKASTNKPANQKQDAQEEFQKTNQQVNRFKKGKKD